jgi:peptidyl-prolyl cis-trans isomerase D
VQLTAEDLRRYYEQNRQTEFSEASKARFRLIRIDWSRVGSEAEARKKAEELITRAQSGADFADLASLSHDEYYAKRGGDVGEIEQNAWREKAVEDAVWQLEPGQVTPKPIAVDKSFYIAKLETKTIGSSRPFESQQVQQTIRGKLEKEQFNALRESFLSNLRKNAIVRQDAHMMDTLLDMAVQQYPRWAAK